MFLPDLVGKQLNEFKVLERIGRGGMATVYRAHQSTMNRDVALKVIPLDDPVEQSDDFRRRFAQEASVIAALEHIHILPVYSYGIQDNIAYLSMRLLRGGSLSQLMKKERLPVERAVEIFTQIAQGLAYAHSKGVIHRDLKPTNILLDEVGHAYLTDFGLAKMVESDQQMTKSGNIVGTPAYMSPEQLRGDPLDHRSDIYSLGIILYEMVAGRQPFESESSDIVTLIYKHLEKPPTPPSVYNPDIPAEIEAIILRALSKSPSDRFESAGMMAKQLREAVGAKSSTGPFPAPNIHHQTTIQRRREQRRRAGVFGLMAAVVFALTLAGSALVLPRLNPQNQATPTIAATATFAPLNVLVDQVTNLARIVPTESEIEIAQRRLGEDGFIAVMACNQTSEYHASLTRETIDFLGDYGLRGRVYDANTDAYEQLTLLQRAQTEGAAGFIICPLDWSLLDPTMQRLDERDYPIIIPYGNNGDSYGAVVIETNNYLLGRMPGETAGQIIRTELGGQANVVVLGYPGHEERSNGLKEGMLAIAPNAEIVAEETGATREFGRESIEKLIEDGVEFNVILSMNDAGSFGAIEALEDADVEPESVIIVSVDAEQLALRYISEGYFMRGSVEVARTDFARGSVDAMVKMLSGSPIGQKVILQPGEVVTKEVIERRSSTP